MSTAEIVVQDGQRAVEKRQPANMSEIMELVRGLDPVAMPGVLNGLLDFQIRVDERAAKDAFDAALIAAQHEMPRVAANGRILNKTGGVQSRYSKYEDIDLVTRPIMERHGLAISYDNPELNGTTMVLKAVLRHIQGHKEPYVIHLPVDKSEYRSGPQNAISTLTYAKRNLKASIFDVITEGEDKNGAEKYEVVTQDQADTLDTMLKDAGVDPTGLCKIYKVGTLKEIPAMAYLDAVARVKRRTGK